jgi:DNA-binding MarR family transcriptional regulator
VHTDDEIKAQQAERLADLSFELLNHCHKKQGIIASNVGLTIAEFKVMRAFRADQQLTGQELSDRIALSGSRMTRILDGLVAKQLVRREIGVKDRRTMEVYLTDGGRETTEKLQQSYVEAHIDIIELLPKGAGESVILAIEKLRDAMKSWAA